MTVTEAALLNHLRLDTAITSLIDRASIWINLAPETAPFPRIVFSRQAAQHDHLAGRRPDRATFLTETYHVEAIDAGPAAVTVDSIEDLLYACLDDADLFALNSDVDPTTGARYTLLDCRVTDRIQRSEIVQRPAGATIWYRGVILRLDLQRHAA